MVIRPEDRESLGLLWISHLLTQHQPLPPIVQWRMTRVPFPATSNPFLLVATLHHHFSVTESLFTDTVACLKESFYISDLVVGANRIQKPLQIYTEARTILADAGKEIRK